MVTVVSMATRLVTVKERGVAIANQIPTLMMSVSRSGRSLALKARRRMTQDFWALSLAPVPRAHNSSQHYRYTTPSMVRAKKEESSA